MLKGCVHLLGLSGSTQRESRRKREPEGAPISVGLCIQSRDFSVRIVHPGGREELYQYALPASHLMEKYHLDCSSWSFQKTPGVSVMAR